MAPPTEPPNADRELRLISTVDLRIALSSVPTQLQPQINTYLPPLLLKLASPHPTVRAKTREVARNISVRLRNERGVGLPVGRLVDQFRDMKSKRGEGEGEGGDVGLGDEVRRFGLVFIGMGLSRIGGSTSSTQPGETDAEIKALLSALLKLPSTTQDGGEAAPLRIQPRTRESSMSLDTRLYILGLFFLLNQLPGWTVPERGSKEDAELKTTLDLSEQETRLLAKWLAKFLLCDSPAFAAASAANHHNINDNTTGSSESEVLLPPLPGLTAAERSVFATWAATKREASKNTAAFEQSITQTKLAVAKFLFTAVFTDAERFLPATIMGADDSNLGLYRVGDTMSKTCEFDLESQTHVEELYGLYLGQPEVGDTTTDGTGDQVMEGDANGEEEQQRRRGRRKGKMETETEKTLPAKPKLQIRILNLLAKSQMATTATDKIVKLLAQQFTAVTDFGLEATKLRTALFNFLNWASRVASEDDIQAIAPQVVDGFRSYVVDQGWPNPGEVTGKPISRSELDMRGKAYDNIGIWAARREFGKSAYGRGDEEGSMMNLVKILFTSLRCDASSPDIQVSIESGLGRLLNRFVTPMDGSVTRRLRRLLMREINTEVGDVDSRDGYKTVRSSKFAAVRFANRCLPFADCEARWMDLVAIWAGGTAERQEIVEEGTKGLDPYWWSTLNGSQATADQLKFPNFDELVERFFGRATREKTIKELQQEYRQEYRQGLPPAVAFCRNVLIREALQSADMAVPIEPDWEKKSDALVATNEKVRSKVRSHLKKIKLHPLTTLIGAALTGMSLHLGRCAESAVEICSMVPDNVVEDTIDRVVMIKPTTVSNNLVVQLQAARLLGIFVSHPQYSELDREDSIRGALTKIQGWRDAVGQEVNHVRGSVLCVTFIQSRQALRGTLSVDDDDISAFMKHVLDLILESKDNALRGASHVAIGQLMLCLDQSVHKKLDLQSEKVIEQLVKDAKKEQESAVIALGRFIRGLSGDKEASDMTEKALTSLYALHEIKRPELQFAIGEALSVAVAGWNSKAMIADFDLDIPRPPREVNEAMLESMLDKIISDCKNTKPSLKKASAIWLLCLIQYVGDQQCVQFRLRQCQDAFARLLSDRDEIVQETGSRGLSLVYEMGDKNLKDDLVRDLVTSFTGSNAKLGGTVTSETELFDAGALPTGDGSVTTYKDIVNLASEMGDPSLVYRFMNLASNNAIWTNRSAFGRFGLGNVLADSAYLSENKNFYPKLYRYCFDPNPNVQRSMNDIWYALVKDSNAVIDQNFEPIIEDLLKSMVIGKEWRVRQASCAAIADVIQGRDIDKYEKYLNEIWSKAFKVLDDIKETVRVAAMTLCRTLTNLLIRNLEVGEETTKRAQKMLDHSMPFLLQQLESGSAKEVQEYAIRTLLKVIKKSPPKALRPYAPAVLEALIKSLDSLEPESVNYLHLNAEKYGLTAEKLDSARVSHVSSSPALQAIERCLEGLDENGMPEAMKRLEGSFKTVIGLPSKVGLSRALVTLTVRHNLKFRPYADRFAQQLRKHLLDRNETITNSFCLALAYLMRIATDKEIEETSRFAKDLYFASDEAGHRHVAGEIVHAISKVSNDRFMSFATAFLPFAFIGRNDIDTEAREPFQRTWEENVGGSRAVSLYLMDIVDLAQHIDSPKWGVKHTIASATADLICCLDSAVDGNYTLSQAEAIWLLLEKALSGKTWDGKEVVVDAFPKYVKKAQTLWESKGDQVDKIALREAKRTDPKYRPHSINALGEIVKTRGGLDLAQKVLTAMSDVVEELCETSEDRMDVDAGKASLSSEAKRDASLDKILSAVIACCFKAVTFVGGGGATSDNLRRLMTILGRSLPKSSTLSYLATYEGIKILIRSLIDRSRQEVDDAVVERSMAISGEERESVKGIATSLVLPISPLEAGRYVPLPEKSDTEAVRIARAQALLAYATFGFQHNPQEVEKASMAVKLWLNNERSSPVRDILHEANTFLLKQGKDSEL